VLPGEDGYRIVVADLFRLLAARRAAATTGCGWALRCGGPTGRAWPTVEGEGGRGDWTGWPAVALVDWTIGPPPSPRSGLKNDPEEGAGYDAWR
jgi:hypothetical protein